MKSRLSALVATVMIFTIVAAMFAVNPGRVLAAEAPTIHSFAPVSAGEGSEVVIAGANFTAATSVTFGGVKAFDFTVDSDTQITAKVAYGSGGSVGVVTPSGMAQKSGFTYIPSDVYTFDHLPLGTLHQVDNWVSSAPNDGTLHHVATPAAVVGHDGSRAAQFPTTTSDDTAARINDGNFSIPSFAANDIYMIEFETQSTYWGSQFGLIYDANGNGKQDDGENGLQLWGGRKNKSIELSAQGGAVATAGSFPEVDDFIRYQIVLDMEGHGGAGSASVWYKNMTANSAWKPAAGMQDVNMYFDMGAGSRNPANWNGMYLYSNGNGPVSVFDNIAFRRVGVSSRSVFFSNTIVGANNTRQVSLGGDHLTGNLNAALTGDYEFTNGTQFLAGLNDGSVIEVIFRPTAEGARAGALTLQGEDMNAPLTIALSGVGDNTGTIFTVAGNGTDGFSGDNGIATSAKLSDPRAMATDGNGNLYFADSANNRIRKVDSDGIITTVVGTGLDEPYGLAVDSANNLLYVADTNHNVIRKYDLDTFTSSGTVSTPGITLSYPNDVAVDRTGKLYISDSGQHRIVKADPVAGTAAILAGTGTDGHSGDGGPATAAQISNPEDIAIDNMGNLYFTEYTHSVVRKVDANGIITTVAGTYNSAGYAGDGGLAVNARINQPESVAVDSAGNIYIGDKKNYRVRRVNAITGIITTVAGTGVSGYSGDHGAATSAKLNSPQNIWVDSTGDIYFSDFYNHVVRKVRGPFIDWAYGYPRAGTATDDSVRIHLKTTASGRAYYVALPHGGAAPSAAQIKAGQDEGGHSLTAGLAGVESLEENTEAEIMVAPLPPAVYDIYILAEYVSGAEQLPIVKITAGVAGTVITVAGYGTQGFGGDDSPATGAEFRYPRGLATDRAGYLYIGDNNRVRRVDAGTDFLHTVAGNVNFTVRSGDEGLATDAGIEQIRGLAFDNAGNMYISDWESHTVRKVDANGVITTVAGGGPNASVNYSGPATGAKLNHPHGIAADSDGNLYIADTDNNVIRRVDSDGDIATVAGNGTAGFSGDGGTATAAGLNAPQAVAIDSKGDLYIGDTSNFRIRRVDRATGAIVTVAGDGSMSYPLAADGRPAIDSTGVYPLLLAIDGADNLYIGQNQFIRRIDAATGMIHRIFGNRTAGFTGHEFTGDNGPAVTASANNIYAMTVTPAGHVYFEDGESRVREIFAPYLSMTASAGTVADTSATVNVQLSQGGKAYFVALPAGAAPPSYDQVKAGTDADDQAVSAGMAGQTILTANTPKTFSLTSLSVRTSYDIYVAAENTAQTEQFQPTKVAIATVPGDAEAVAADKASLAIGYAPGDSAASVTQDVYLPTVGPNGTTISWASNGSGVVSVTGAVYRPNSGNAVVALTATIGKGSASDMKLFILNVIGNPATLAFVGQDHWKYTLNVGETHQTKVTAVYSDQSRQEVTAGSAYLSSNPAVASVNASGLVTAHGAGTTTITATFGGKSMTQELTVQEAEPDFTLTLDINPEHVVGDGVSRVTITGTVLTRAVQPTGVPNVPITFHFGNGTTVTQTVYTNSDGMAQVIYTAPDLAGVDPQTEIVSVEAVDTVTGAKTVNNVEVRYMPATISGVVKDHAGHPLKDAAVSVTADFNNDGIVDFHAEGLTAANGSYSFVVPRGNWIYSIEIHKQIQLDDGRTVMVDTTQTAPVGTLNGTGERIPSANQISGIVTAVNPDNTTTTTGALFGAGNVTAQITGTGGTVYNNIVALDANGKFNVSDIPTGSYQIRYQITSPEGDVLIGPMQTVTVGASGQVSVADSLIDPYGTVTDADTGQPISGVTLTLKWAYTAGGHRKDDPVPLPELPNFAPNRNHNSQQTTAQGKYGWMVFPDEDYYIVAKKSGYQSYSSLATPPADVPPAGGSTSSIHGGIIHVGNTIVKLDFSMKKQSSSSVEPGPQVPGQPESGEVTDTTVTLTWEGSGGHTYNVYVNGEPVATGIAGNSYTITGLTPGTEYVITVTGVSSGVESAASTELRVTTGASDSDDESETGGFGKYVSGYPNGRFQPNRKVSRAEMAVMLHLAMQPNDAASATGEAFPDVPETFWGSQAIATVSGQGFMIGYPDDSFQPNRMITRAEMAVIAVKARHLELVVGEAAYTDTKNSWANRFIAAATAADLMQGYPDGTFRPDQPLTRAEAVAVINRLTRRDPLTNVSQPTWPDVSPDFWAYGDIEAASTTRR